jgi:2,4-dienoyl-CoA reductase-like NADH-dependent reductase (Old Yellow Enzyme family)/NADPH-dependent 2,4-dienoyl-CoA reductase/sulfur reductase-like enzyme
MESLMTNFPHLVSPLQIGPMTLKNRMAVTSMGVSLAEEDGTCGDRVLAYHREQARGGAGLVTLGVTGVAFPVGGNQVRQIAISDDRFIPGLRRIADAVHEYGGKVAAQIHHGGLLATVDMRDGRPLWCPSLPPLEVGDFMDGFLPEEVAQALLPKGNVELKVMDKADIAQLIAWFAAAAGRARKAGLDGLEIHAGHGYIISSFLSPATNRRTDEYGGTPENRARLMLEVLQVGREAAGPSMAVWVKLDGEEYGRKGGITIDDAIRNAKMAEAAGAQAIATTAYHDSSMGILHSGSHTPQQPGLNVNNAATIKAVVRIPVFASGRIEPDIAERLIGEGKFDMLYMGRKILADPHLPRKIAEGRPDDILPCIYCYTCISQIYFAKSVKCAVNPETAFERELQVQKTGNPKRIVVIGGGPAGMESARRLSLKGHAVTLIERSDRLGGTLQFAAIAYEPNERILDWLKRQISESAVDVRLKTDATVERLRSFAPDEIVVATGAIRSMPSIPGADRLNVFSGDEMRKLVLGDDLAALKGKVSWTSRMASKAGSATGITKSPALIREATKAWMPLGERIVIIGGELVGLELAEFLAHRGRKVTVVDETPKFGAGLQIVRRLRVLRELKDLGVASHAGAKDISIGEGEVTWGDPTGHSVSAGADHVIVAKGARGDTSLADTLKEAGFKVHVAGDAGGVGYIEGAMRTAADLAQFI